MHLNNDLTTFIKTLDENTLYATDMERAALMNNHELLANIFMFNFLGMLGMINATSPDQKRIIIKYLKKDKHLRLSTIGEENHDISLILKLIHEAGYFKKDSTVNEITRFMVKLKNGQIDQIDSTVVAGWLQDLLPTFQRKITNPKMRTLFRDFVADGGENIDVSRFAVLLKKQINKVDGGGDYKRYAKRFFGLTEIQPTKGATDNQPSTDDIGTDDGAATDGSAANSADGSDPQKPLSYYQRQKLKKQAEQEAADAAAAKAAAASIASEEEKKQQDKQRRIENIDQITQSVDKDALIRYTVGMLRPAPNFSHSASSYSTMSLEEVQTEIINISSSPLKAIQYMYDGMHRVVAPEEIPQSTKQLIKACHGILESLSAMVREDASDIASAIRQFNQAPGNGTVTIDQLITVLCSTDVPFASQRKGLAIVMSIASAHNKLSNSALLSRFRGSSEQSEVIQLLFIDIVDKKANANTSQLYSQLVGAGLIDDSIIRTLLRRSVDVSWDRNVRLRKSTLIVLEAFEHDPGVFERTIDDLVVNISDGRFIPEALKMLKGLTVSGESKVYDNSEIDDVYVSRFIDRVRNFVTYKLFTPKYKSLLINLILNHNTSTKYDSALGDKGGLFHQMLHETYKDEVIRLGPEQWIEDANVSSSGYAISSFSEVMKQVGVTISDMMTVQEVKTPLMIRYQVKDEGLTAITKEEMISFVTAERKDFRGDVAKPTPDKVLVNITSLRHSSGGDPEENADILCKLVVELLDRGDVDIATPNRGLKVLDALSGGSSEAILAYLEHMKNNDHQYGLTVQQYKDMHKTDKGTFVEVLTGVILDSIGTPYESIVNDVVEELAPHVKQKIRSSLVGSQALIDDMNKGDIKPFDRIDNARLKKIFMYNDINLSKIVSSRVGKKKKSETYTEFFARAKTQMDQQGTALDDLKIEKNEMVDPKRVSNDMINNHYAGRHGRFYPKVHKVFDGTSSNSEFDEFAKEYPLDGNIVPAYHGTGGIAAAMILRYGFKIVQSSDPSVVGRMLGDGIYFSNKIDKAMQYMSNGGYSRQYGNRGYIFLMDVNLGKLNKHYSAAGVGGTDRIRSPEWCVMDPKAQLHIRQVYEVETSTKETVMSYISESVDDKRRSFKQYVNEQRNLTPVEATTFIFRDGMIPIVEAETEEVVYVDFEEALEQKLFPEDLYEATAHGPALTFPGTATSEVYDQRYARLMTGEPVQLYKELFTQHLSRLQGEQQNAVE